MDKEPGASRYALKQPVLKEVAQAGFIFSSTSCSFECAFYGERPLLADSGPSCFGLLRYLERVVNLNPKVSDSALQLAVSKEELDRPKVLGPAVDQSRLGPPHGVRPIAGAIQSDFAYPAVNDSGVLAGRKVWRGSRSAREDEVGAAEPRCPGPSLESLSAHFGYLELHRPPCFPLHHDRTRVDVILVGNVADSKTQEVAGTEL